MKLTTSILAFAALAAFVAAPAVRAQADNDAVKSKLKEMEDSWAKSQMSADHGAAAVSEMLASGFVGISSTGAMQDKEARVKQIKEDTDTYTSSSNDKMEVDVFAPNLAIVRGVSTEAGKDKHGKAFKRTFVWADTWMEQDGKWQCITSAGAPLKKKKE
ncbi:MAG TPA: nuclear transport factor 2 family protein [Chthoniobacterales bacterium]